MDYHCLILNSCATPTGLCHQIHHASHNPMPVRISWPLLWVNAMDHSLGVLSESRSQPIWQPAAHSRIVCSDNNIPSLIIDTWKLLVIYNNLIHGSFPVCPHSRIQQQCCLDKVLGALLQHSRQSDPSVGLVASWCLFRILSYASVAYFVSFVNTSYHWPG